MRVLINGEPQTVTARTVAELLNALGYQDRTVAVAINKNCVRRTLFCETALREGDELEILAPMAGG